MASNQIFDNSTFLVRSSLVRDKRFRLTEKPLSVQCLRHWKAYSFHSQAMSMCWTGQLNIISNDQIYFDSNIYELTILGNRSECSTKNTLKKQNIYFAGWCLIFDLNRVTARYLRDTMKCLTKHVNEVLYMGISWVPVLSKISFEKAIPIFRISNSWMSPIITLNVMFFFSWHLKSNRTHL